MNKIKLLMFLLMIFAFGDLCCMYRRYGTGSSRVKISHGTVKAVKTVAKKKRKKKKRKKRKRYYNNHEEGSKVSSGSEYDEPPRKKRRINWSKGCKGRDGKFRCPELGCNRKYGSSIGLRIHLLSEEHGPWKKINDKYSEYKIDKNRYKCPECEEVYTRSSIESHIPKCNGRKRIRMRDYKGRRGEYLCPDCEEKFRYSSRLRRHLLGEEHGSWEKINDKYSEYKIDKNRYKCPECEEVYTRSSIEGHIPKCNGRKRIRRKNKICFNDYKEDDDKYHCQDPDCKEKYSAAQGLKQHFLAMEHGPWEEIGDEYSEYKVGKNKYRCPKCGNIRARNHLFYNNCRKEVDYDSCDDDDDENNNDYLDESPAEVSYVCWVCSRFIDCTNMLYDSICFKSEEELNRHMREKHYLL